MANKYIELEPGTMQQLYGKEVPTFDASQPVSTYMTFNFLYVSAITLIIAASAVMYIIAGAWRIEASERGIRKSDETFKRVTLGLIGVLSLFTILYTVNKDLLLGDVGLDKLKASVAAGTGSVVPVTNQTSATPSTCVDPATIIASMSSPGGLCGSATCSALSGCNYQQYLPIIQNEAKNQGVANNVALIVSIMCQESKGKSQSQNKNPDGTYDCGLMQVNQQTPCGADVLDPAFNISAGIKKIKQVLGTHTYGNIPAEASVAASYNAGAGYNAQSTSCNPSTGFSMSIPKWACPIDPGDGKFNMCAVKTYACGISACVIQLSASGI